MANALEADQIWDWIQWRLPADIWLEAQSRLRSPSPPTPADPLLAAMLAELQDPLTTRARRLQLLEQLLRIIKTRS